MHIADQAVHAWTATPLDESLAIDSWIRQPNSRFALIAAHSESLPPELENLLCLLLPAMDLGKGTGRPFLAPLWAEADMHRAYAMLRLFDRRAERHRGRMRHGFTARVECALARSLASAYRSMATAREEEFVQCATLLRDVALDLGALFGGGIAVRTIIERLRLPAYKRRALVLSASELVMNALTHAFADVPKDGRADGLIEVSLRLMGEKHACLRVADNGAGFGARRPNTAISIAGGLAELVEANLTYGRTAEWTTVADIVFPIASAASAPTARIIELAHRFS